MAKTLLIYLNGNILDDIFLKNNIKIEKYWIDLGQ